MLKRIPAILLVLMLLVALIPAPCAEAATPRYSHILSIGAGIDLNGSSLWYLGQADSMFTDTTTHMMVTLYRRPIGGSSWYGVQTAYANSQGVIPSYIEKTVTVSSGYDYRIYVGVTIRDADGNKLESSGMYSRTVSYPNPSN